MARLTHVCCIRSYHIYRRYKEVIFCEREPTNSQEKYAVTVKEDNIIGHLPHCVFARCFERSLD